MSRFYEASHLSRSSSGYSTSSAKKLEGHDSGGFVVVRSNRGWILCRHGIHIAAVAVTAGLAAINILNVYLMDADIYNTAAILNAFQFAAKLHEVLIVGSLMMILMDTIRSRLITSTGVPFGYLLAPVLFNDLDWLFNHRFWSSVKPTRSSLPLTLLVLVSIPFANIAGPLSAIAVVPRLGFSRPVPAAVFPSFWNASATDIWPARLTAASLDPICFEASGMANGCPGGAVKAIRVVYDPVFSTGLLCTSTGSLSSCNTTTGTSRHRQLSIELDLNTLTTFSSTPTDTIFEILGNRFASGIARPLDIADATAINAGKTELVETRFVGNKEVLKPVTNVTCEEMDYAEIYQTFQDFDVRTNWSTPLVHWLGDSDGSQSPSFMFTYLKNDPVLTAATDCDGQNCYKAVRCLIDARWFPSRTWYNTAQSSTLYQSDPQPKELFESNAARTVSPIIVEKSWLEGFSRISEGNASEQFRDLLNAWQVPMVGLPKAPSIGAAQALFQPSNYTQAISVILSGVITEALSGFSAPVGESIYGGNCSDTAPGFTFDSRICAQDPSHWVHATDLRELQSSALMTAFTVRRAGYGWFIDSLTVKIALGILLLHGFLTLSYLAAVLALRREITTCWSSAPEMLMLAVDSLRAPVMMGSSAKATHRDLWREPVSVMEVDGGERVSLVVGDPLSYFDRLGGPPILGKKYS